ncbi:hypothetical protein [Falsiroseomonas sp. E2-1-a20]|uniref:hypothetical protein n=1 Tax=Falsiroseomonas sp. E2-1-a20 TaxID=3239300 RepID=UPI003F380148
MLTTSKTRSISPPKADKINQEKLLQRILQARPWATVPEAVRIAPIFGSVHQKELEARMTRVRRRTTSKRWARARHALQPRSQSEENVNDDELIYRIAHHMDPLVFEHEGSRPPAGFLGSPEWWTTAKHSRRQRATEAAAPAVKAIRQLEHAIVPCRVTPDMARAGAALLSRSENPAQADEELSSRIWVAMQAAAEQAAVAQPQWRSANGDFPMLIRRKA